MNTILPEDLQRDLPSPPTATEPVVRDSRETHPAARIGPAAQGPPLLRPFGLAAGEFVVPDDFDADLPDELLRMFEGR